MANDTTTVTGSGSIADPQRVSLFFKRQNVDGTVTYYTTGQKKQNLILDTEEPDLENSLSGIYFQLPKGDISNG